MLLHGMLAVDADTGSCLGLVAGRIWTRRGTVKVAHQKRPSAEKESSRWSTTPEQGKDVLAAAAKVTVLSDREGDIFAAWGSVPAPGFHMIARSMHERRLANGKGLYAAAEHFAFQATRIVALPEREGKRAPRVVKLALRFGKVELARPNNTRDRGLPQSVTVTLVEVIERDPPRATEAVHWRLLTTHDVADAEAAWQIVEWYKLRWIIEQFWRLLKLQGLKLEDSQIETADRLQKLTAIAAKAAVMTLQLLQARNGPHSESATIAFGKEELAVLDHLNAELQGATALQKNPHRHASLRWAAWIIAKLGGWDGYPSSKSFGSVISGSPEHNFRAGQRRWRERRGRRSAHAATARWC